MNHLGARGLQLLKLNKRLIRSYLKHNMTSYAATLAYRALFALFPLLILLVAVLDLLEVSSFFDWLIGLARSTLQEKYSGAAEQWIEQSRNLSRGELLSISIVNPVCKFL